MTKTSGRQIEVGIGIESTAGTPVAATDYFKWDTFSMQSYADKVLLNSARGIRNKISNSITNRRYGKGAVEFVPTVDMMPYILHLLMGTYNVATASGESAVYNHTFTINNNNAAMKTATLLVAQGGIQTERYSNSVAETMDLTFDKDFGKCKVGFVSGYPDTGSISSSYTQDTLFTRNQLNATFGTSLSNATATLATTTATTDATNAVNLSTITIGFITYTFVTALSNAGYTPYEVLIKGTAALTLANLKAAINGTGTAGTDYGIGTNPHPLVTATTITSTTLIIQAIVAGTTANSIATTSTTSPNSHITFTGATINSGTPGTGPNPTPLVNFTLSINNNVQFDDAFLSGSNRPIAGGFVAGPLDIKGSYTVQFADVVELGKYQNDTKSAMIATLVGARVGVLSTEQIVINLGRLVLTKAPIEYMINGINYIKQEFTVQYDATDKECSIVVTNTNAGASY